jgi:hypothetical protein
VGGTSAGPVAADKKKRLRDDRRSPPLSGDPSVFELNILRCTGNANSKTGTGPMLWTVAIVLLVLWALGLVTSYTLGGFIHILIVVAIIIVLVQFIQGRR